MGSYWKEFSIASRIHDKHGDVSLLAPASARACQQHIFLGAVWGATPVKIKTPPILNRSGEIFLLSF